MYLVFTRMSGESYRRRLRSLLYLCYVFRALIDDLRKSRGLHSVSAYRHGLYIYRSRPAGVAQSRRAFVSGYSEHVGKMTDTRKRKAEKASEMPIKRSLFVGNMQIGY